MGSNPKNKINYRTYKSFHNNTTDISQKTESLEGISRDEYIFEQASKGASPNEIKATLKIFKRMKGYSSRIRKVLASKSEQIRRINATFDAIACKKVHLLSLDETYKGRRVIILVMIDAITGYIICIRKIKDRKIPTIVKALRPYQDLFDKIELILTDGATYFPEVINQLFPNIRH